MKKKKYINPLIISNKKLLNKIENDLIKTNSLPKPLTSAAVGFLMGIAEAMMGDNYYPNLNKLTPIFIK